ncbi:IPT/TIG domain-containing protein [Actinoplanes auranticolor]|uniref:IPT/TIG domain-containing protein n=1 Tax=Actinoplanes auranticolor TaxID=47988 RepID=A0A919S3K0_9ACTN|nr:IPT/TIG domain-containing protein [Actinoplanes auranticolor]GIM63365.1 hypothetical protein Aau02nite_03570 [Actinoplanes auranticolor]
MRKSKSRSSRMVTAAGLTTGAVGVALLVAPSAAFAAVAVTPPVVAPGGVVTITDTAPNPLFSAGTGVTAARVQILTGATATCGATLATPTSAILASDGTYTNTSTTTSVTFKMPAAATAGTNGQAKRYIACVYAADGSTARAGLAAGYPVLVGTAPTLSSTSGPSGGGNTVEVKTSTPLFTGVSTVSAQFSTASTCAATYGTPAAGLVGTVNRVSDSAVNVVVPAGVTTDPTTPASSVLPLQYSLCLYNGVAAGSTLISAAPYTASLLILSQQIAGWQGGNALNVTTATDLFAGVEAPGVSFQKAACDTTYEETAAPQALHLVTQTDVRKVTDARVAVTVPAFYPNVGAFNTAAPTGRETWNLCIYAGTADESSPLLASNSYSITTLHSATGITPKAGPALGGSRIVVSGSAFPTNSSEITATLGGTALTDITAISSTAFSATTPSHAPANNVALVVTTPFGQHILPNAYSYTSALRVTPNTAPNTRAVNVIVRGVGFQSASFQTTPDAGAHIYLVEGTYSGVTVGSDRANAPVTDCVNTLILSDTEVICTLNLHRRLNTTGAAFVDPFVPAAAVATTIDTVTGSRIISAAAATFTEENIGMILDETGAVNIPVGTTITAVLSDTQAIISNAALDTNSDITARWLTPAHRTGVSITTAADANITAGPGTTFTQADVGKVPVGANFTPGTSIISVTSPTAAVLSAAAIGTPGTNTVNLHHRYTPVPEGAYNLTYVSNGAVGAVGTDPNYIQSLVSSTSTFTVSSF